MKNAHHDDPRTAEGLISDIDGLRAAALRYSKRVAIIVADLTNSPDCGAEDATQLDAAAALYEVRSHLRCMAGELRRLRRKLGIKVTPADKVRSRIFDAECALDHAKRDLAAIEPKAVQP